jgi:hypothetical protein
MLVSACPRTSEPPRRTAGGANNGHRGGRKDGGSVVSLRGPELGVPPDSVTGEGAALRALELVGGSIKASCRRWPPCIGSSSVAREHVDSEQPLPKGRGLWSADLVSS